MRARQRETARDKEVGQPCPYVCVCVCVCVCVGGCETGGQHDLTGKS